MDLAKLEVADTVAKSLTAEAEILPFPLSPWISCYSSTAGQRD